MSIKRLIAVSAATLAAGGLLVPPVSAAELPRLAHAPAVYDSHAEDAFGYRHRHWRRDRVNGGDIVAGVLVLGAVAAIASAASESNRDRDPYRDRYRDRPADYREPARPSPGWGQGGIGNAVDLCVAQVERGRTRVDSVDNAARDAGGWHVSGTTSDGEAFSCRLDNDGRIRAVDLGDGYAANYRDGAAVAAADGQLSDETYLRARAALRHNGGGPVPAGAVATGSAAGGADADLGNGPQPAYPGGPLPGEEGYEASFGG